MSDITVPLAGPPAFSQAPGEVKPRNEREAAEQFEALLIAQLLKSARESNGEDGWLGTGEDKTSETIAEYAEQQVAQMLSSSGGFGLAELIARGLRPTPQSERSAAEPEAAGEADLPKPVP